MPTSLTECLTEMQGAKFHPGHSLILEPPEGPSALACTCGGFLELKPDTRSAQIVRYRAHLEEAVREATPS
ncbi:hypothetical protein [Streptomyces botrytidirepellens]|uniref:Uncharacterized protein n=1 Tax=Streptomyces botrytidirepellens TaxID=2486417 RepID=A0A3M8VBH9_9ACTN|nr:hypothetical protein [Streptomyces botrytidirepellens]RNG13815.1 hypothetical protein EEJ42_31655 [Streptomyces botrytidirepellens]